jgi:DNA-binding CsgD family transcriptional regulator
MKRIEFVEAELYRVYPLNVYSEMLEIDRNTEIVSDCNMRELLWAIESLKEREKAIIKLVYQKCLGAQEVSNMCHITVENVRNIKSDALRKLRAMNFDNKMSVRASLDKSKYIDEINTLREEVEKLKRECLELKNIKRRGRQVGVQGNNIRAIFKPLEDWNFSSRVYNAIRGAGCRSILDLLKLYSKYPDCKFYEFLINIRGFGEVSIKEVNTALLREGIRIQSYADLQQFI